MTRRHSLVVVEGPHDQAFVGRVLCLLGFVSFKDKPDEGREDRLDPFWETWKPDIKKNRKLYEPIFMPAIFSNQTQSILVLVAGGSSVFRPFANRLLNKRDWLLILADDGGAIALLADADSGNASDAQELFKLAYGASFSPFPDSPGLVQPCSLNGSSKSFRMGTFILPNNQDRGTVESVLLPVGRENLGPILTHADTFVDGCEPELKAHFAPFDHLKARVAAAASILQPGATNTVTIEKDDWITARQLHHPALVPFVKFLCDLLDLPLPPAPRGNDEQDDLLDLLQGLS